MTTPQKKNDNSIALGYQIGGYNLIGIDYELRLHDAIGIHFGGGFLGYTAGLKIHTKPGKNSSFFNLSFKDGGLGQLQTLGVEYGAKWVFNEARSDFGLIGQVGFHGITKMSTSYENTAYPASNYPDGPPSAIFVIGIGFTW